MFVGGGLNRDLIINEQSFMKERKFLDARYFTDYTMGKKSQAQTQSQSQTQHQTQHQFKHTINDMNNDLEHNYKLNDNLHLQNNNFTDSWMKYDKNNVKVTHMKGQPYYSFNKQNNNLNDEWLRSGESTRTDENYLRKQFGKNNRNIL